MENPELIGKDVHVAWWGWYPMREYWSYPGFEGQSLTVHVYSTGEEVALYLNHRLLGTAPAGRNANYTATFSVPYAPGELAAVAMNDGHETGRHTLRTPGTERMLTLNTDQKEAEGDALIYVQVQLTDSDGNPVFDQEKAVAFSAAGPQYFVAAGNTAIQTTANYSRPVQDLYEGYALAVFRPVPAASGAFVRALDPRNWSSNVPEKKKRPCFEQK